MRILMSGVLSVGVLACTAIPPPSPWNPGQGYQNAGYAPPGQDVGHAGDPRYNGRDFCRDLANRAQRRAGHWANLGWTLSIGAGVATAAGTISLATESDPSAVRQGFNLGLPVLGGLLSTVALAVFDREGDLDGMASAAAAAVNATEDAAAAKACNEAIADWNSARARANERAVQYLDNEVRKRDADERGGPDSAPGSAPPPAPATQAPPSAAPGSQGA